MRSPGAVLVIGTTIVLLIVGCTPTPAKPTKSPAASTSPIKSTTPTPLISPASGCPATPNSSMATGATAAATVDVDGDGRADREWITTAGGATVFGVTTASGATFSYSVTSASPIPRGGFVARLSPSRVISVLTDGRQAYLHVVANCSFVQPVSSDGKAFTFDLQNLRGNGTGVGCVAVDNGAEMVGYLATSVNGGTTVTQTIIELDSAGTGASTGAVSTLAVGAASNSPIAVAASSVSCGNVSGAHGGVTLTK